MLNRPNPIREPRTYLVNIDGALYQDTREHLHPRLGRTDPQPPLLKEVGTPPLSTQSCLPAPTMQPSGEEPTPDTADHSGQQTTKSGRVVKTPERNEH